MKRLWPILIPSLLLFVRTWVLVAVLLAEEAGANENAYIKVSVSGDSFQKVLSCTPGLSWVELVNTHPTDEIQILRIDTIEMDTSNSKRKRFFNINQKDFPLSLSPGQTEYKPLIFLPNNDRALEDDDVISEGQELMNSLLIIHSAIIRVQTSDGIVYTPLRALSVLSNPYGLPNNLQFKGNLETEIRGTGEDIMHSHQNDASIEVIGMKWEYDIYLSNPSDGKLQVFEIFSSQPSWLEIEIRDHLTENPYGPSEIQPMGTVYIGTVVVLSSSLIYEIIPKLGEDEQIYDTISVGAHVHIRTNLEELVIPINLVLDGWIDVRNYYMDRIKNTSTTEKTQTIGQSQGKEDALNEIETKSKKISTFSASNDTIHEIGYNREDFFFPIDFSSVGDRNVTKNDEKRKSTSGLHLLSIPFRRKEQYDEGSIIHNMYERFISFTNNFTTTLRLVSLTFSSPTCKKWFELTNINLIEETDAEPGEAWSIPDVDVTLTYFDNFSLTNLLPYTSCSLILRTNVSQHDIPIILYRNELLVTAETDTLPPPCKSSYKRNKDSFTDMRECSAQWWDSSQIADAVKSDLSRDRNFLPLPLNFGAISAGEVSVRSLMLTNLNPMPIEVLSSKSSLEGMEVSLGRTTARVADYIPPSEREFWNYPFFPKLGWKNDVKFSSIANESLRESYIKHGTIELFRDANRPSTNFYSSNSTMMVNKDQGGIMLSLDGKYRKQLYSSSSQKPKSWSIPPGAVARFDVYIRAPPKEVLSKDITKFFASGLELQTETTTLDLMITFDTLLGKLDLSPKDDKFTFDLPLNTRHNSSKILGKLTGKALRIPAYLRPNELSKFPLHPQIDPGGIDLLLSSNFSNDFVLNGLESCNSWFSVTTNASSANETLSIHALESSLPIGHLFSAISCKENNFYACAVEWLENANSIQPFGCGLDNNINYIDDNFSMTDKEIKTKFLPALKEAATHISSLYSRTTRYTSEEKLEKLAHEVSPSDILLFSARNVYKVDDNTKTPHSSSKSNKYNNSSQSLTPLEGSLVSKIDRAKQAWHHITSLNISRISTFILAETYHGNGKNDSILTSVPALYAESELQLPNLNSLVNSTLDFNVIRVSSYSFKYITVTNPTAIPIRIRISSLKSPDLFVQRSPDNADSWWTGNNYWMPDGKGNVLLSHHNVTVKSGGGALFTLVNPSLHSLSSFIVGCGKRCGLRNEVNGADFPYTLIGASAAQESSGNLDIETPPAFALGYRSLAEAEIPAFGKAKLGPIYFRPTGKGELTSEVYLQNSLTGLEKIKLKGRGGLEKIAFLHDDIEQRVGRPTLVFPGSTDENNREVEKHITLANIGDLSVNIVRVYMGTSEITHFSNIKSFPKNGFNTFFDKNQIKCEERGFILVGCNTAQFELSSASDNFAVQILENFFSFITFIKSKLNSSRSQSISSEKDKHFIGNNIILHPGHNTSFSILYKLDCTFKTVYVTLNVEYESFNTNGKKEKESKMQLLMGYDMKGTDILRCRSVALNSITIFGHDLPVFKIFTYILGYIYITFVAFWFVCRYTYSCDFRAMLTLNQVLHSWESYVPKIDCDIAGLRSSTWIAPFRSLSKYDISNNELISKGKEQTKQMLDARYKSLGINTSKPQCIVWERTNRTNMLAHVPKKSSDGVIREVLPQTDLVYGSYEQKRCDDLVPNGLGWKFAVNKSIIPDLDSEWNWTMEETRLAGVSKVQELLLKRSKNTCSHKLDKNKGVNVKKISIPEQDSSKVSEEESDDDEAGSNNQFMNDSFSILEKVDADLKKDTTTNTKKNSSSGTCRLQTETIVHNANNISHQKSGRTREQTQVVTTLKQSSTTMKNESKALSINDYRNDTNESSFRRKRYDSNRNFQKQQSQPKVTTKVTQINRNVGFKSASQKTNTRVATPAYAQNSKVASSIKKNHWSTKDNNILADTENHFVRNPNESPRSSSSSSTVMSRVSSLSLSEGGGATTVSPPTSPMLVKNRVGTHQFVLENERSDASKLAAILSSNIDIRAKGTAHKGPNENTLSPGDFNTPHHSFTLPAINKPDTSSEILNKLLTQSKSSSPCMFRPPPGLPPPPGFASESDVTKEKLEPDKTILPIHPSSNSFVNVHEANLNENQTKNIYSAGNLHHINDSLVDNMRNSFFASNTTVANDLNQTKSSVSAIGSERFNMGSDLRMTSNFHVGDGLNSLQSNNVHLGFDVDIEKYVSNILNDSCTSMDDESNNSGELGVSGAVIGSGALNSGNPWDSSRRDHLPSITENKSVGSRAIKYGIEVESENNTEAITGGIIAAPLKAEYLHLSSGSSEQLEDVVYLNAVEAEISDTSSKKDSNKEDEENHDENFFEGDSFIVSLVGE